MQDITIYAYYAIVFAVGIAAFFASEHFRRTGKTLLRALCYIAIYILLLLFV